MQHKWSTDESLYLHINNEALTKLRLPKKYENDYLKSNDINTHTTTELAKPS